MLLHLECYSLIESVFIISFIKVESIRIMSIKSLKRKNKATSKLLRFSEHADLLINKAAFILKVLNRNSDLLIMCWGNTVCSQYVTYLVSSVLAKRLMNAFVFCIILIFFVRKHSAIVRRRSSCLYFTGIVTAFSSDL